MHGKNGFCLGIVLQDFLQSLVHMAHGHPQILPPVGGHEDQLMIGTDGFLQFGVVEIKGILHRSLEGIDHRIPRHIDIVFLDVFLQEIGFGIGRRCKMEICDGRRQFPVHLFWERRILVAGAESCLHMAYRDLLVESSQRSYKGRSGIPMDQDQIRLCLFQDFLQTHQGTAGHIIQSLACGHDVQIIIRFDLEQIQHLIQHFPVLGRHRNDGFQHIRILFHFQYQRAHLNGFRPGTENRHDFQFVHFPSPLFHDLSCKIPIFLAPMKITASRNTSSAMA